MGSTGANRGHYTELQHADLPEGAQEEMARHLLSEFVRQGFTDSQILGIFGNPLSGGPHAFCRVKGEKWVRELLAQIRGEEDIERPQGNPSGVRDECGAETGG